MGVCALERRMSGVLTALGSTGQRGSIGEWDSLRHAEAKDRSEFVLTVVAMVLSTA